MELVTHSLCGLRPVRNILGVKAADIAARLSITVTTYNRFERGERRCYFDQAITIAKMLDVSIEQLTREPSPQERIDLFNRRQQTQANVPDETKRELQHEREQAVAEEVRHDLADHGFVTEVTEEDAGVDDGTVVPANMDVTSAEPSANDEMLADWGFEDDGDE